MVIIVLKQSGDSCLNNRYTRSLTVMQGQKFVAVLKAKNRGAATSQNVKNRGDIAAKIVKIAAISRQMFE